MDYVKAAPMMKIFLNHCGVESMEETLKTIPATMTAVKEYIAGLMVALPLSVTELSSLQAKPYIKATKHEGWENIHALSYLPDGDKTFRSIIAFCDQPVHG